MKKEVSYIAFDGKRFNTETECRKYEKEQNSLQKVYKAINTLKNYCKNKECACCSFFDFDKSRCKFIKDIPCRWLV